MPDVPDRPLVRTRSKSADLRTAWSTHADEFIAWARAPDHDSYWKFHREQFLELLPPPGDRTLDLGCGEGRLSRDLERVGHHVVGLDLSERMLAAARKADAAIPLVLADAARLPFGDGSFSDVIAFMSLQDIDGLQPAITEAARVLAAGGRLCLAIVHPLNSAGEFHGFSGDSPFVIEGSYLEQSYYEDDLARDGMQIVFASAHRPLEAYARAIVGSGLLIDRLREPALPDHAVDVDRHRRWQRFPMFLHLRAVKPVQSSSR
jgi:SAM-dependent methyltransferase